VASTYPLIVYSYKRALIKRCAKEYSLFSTEKAAHVCNTAIVKKTLKDSIDDGEEDGDQ
jgi:tubulin polyglutamylase TTLL1